MSVDLGLVDGEAWADEHVDALEAAINLGWNVCTSSTRPVSPATGTLIYETDTGIAYVYNGAIWVEAMRNAARSTYNPAVSQSGVTTNIAHTTNRATASKCFREVRFDFDLSMTAAGTAGFDIVLELPYPTNAANVNGVAGSGFIYDASTGNYYPSFLQVISTTFVKFVPTVSVTPFGYVGGASWVMTLASGDLVRGHGFYEAA